MDNRFGHTLTFLSKDRNKNAIKLCELAEAMLCNCLAKIEQLEVSVIVNEGSKMSKDKVRSIVLTPDKVQFIHPDKN